MSQAVQIQGRRLKEIFIQESDEKNRVTIYYLETVQIELVRLIEEKVIHGCDYLTMDLIKRLRIPNRIVGYSRRHCDDVNDVALGKRLAKRRAFDKFDTYYRHLLCELANELGKSIEKIDTKLGIN